MGGITNEWIIQKENRKIKTGVINNENIKYQTKLLRIIQNL